MQDDAGGHQCAAMPIRANVLCLLASACAATLAAGEPQQVTFTPPKSESTIRAVALDASGQPTAEGQAALAQMTADGWRATGMTALSPTLVAVLYSRSLPPPKPASPPPSPAGATPGQPDKAAPPQSETAIAKALLASASANNLTTTASGLRYLQIRPGMGRRPGPTDQVTVRYTGAKLDGTVFDASARHGGTAQFGLNQVIRGWTEGLQLMQEGAVYHFVIPAELAYGKNGPPSIGPDQTLLFEVELISVR